MNWYISQYDPSNEHNPSENEQKVHQTIFSFSNYSFHLSYLSPDGVQNRRAFLLFIFHLQNTNQKKFINRSSSSRKNELF